MSDIRLRNITKSFGPIEVLHGVDIDIRNGEFVVFVGPSGCGKSTLLRLIAGLEEITSGDLMIDGARVNELSPKDRGIAMVFQSYALYPHMTVYKNMAFGLSLGKNSKAEIDKRVRHAAKILQLENRLNHRPNELSGGQRQRVAIGRAIVRNPKVFLFDEPLSNLDAALRVQTRLEIANLHADLKNTVIYVTHDQVEAMTLADKIVVLHGGTVEQIGVPLELYHKPRNLFVAGFIGSPKMNFLKARVTSLDHRALHFSLGDGATHTLPVLGTAPQTGSEITLGIRPEHLTARGEGIGFAACADAVERLGDVSYVYATMETGDKITMAAPGTSRVGKGDRITLKAKPEHVHIFDETGQAVDRPLDEEWRAGAVAGIE